MKKLRSLLTGALILSVILTSSSAQTQNRSEKKEDQQEILVSKSKGMLYVSNKGTITDSAECSFGFGEYFNPGQKTKRGDKKTPEGEYFVTEKHPSSRYLYFIGISYPNTQDAVRGLEQRLITNPEYAAIVKADTNNTSPPQYTALGGTIG